MFFSFILFVVYWRAVCFLISLRRVKLTRKTWFSQKKISLKLKVQKYFHTFKLEFSMNDDEWLIYHVIF